MERLISFVGLIFLIFVAWAMSADKKNINKRTILAGVFIQFVLGVLILKTAAGVYFFAAANEFVSKILSFSDQGAAMIFGEGFREHYFAFSVLPTIIFMSALMSVLFYLGIIQHIVKWLAVMMVKLMDVSGSESLAASVNIFVGQTEAPLVVKPYIQSMTKSELMCLMVGGFANIAGGVMAAYVGFGADAGHLLASSIISAPASILVAKLLLPEREVSVTKGKVSIEIEKAGENVLEAACIGASDGLKLALNVAAMLIAFVAFTAMLNYGLGFFPDVNGQPLTFERILGWGFAPIAFLIGVPMSDALAVGTLLGKKMFLNEFIAYMDLQTLKDTLTPRGFTLATYALCGFSNFSSIAIQVGGIGELVPSRKKDLARLGFKAMLGGTIATLMTATIAGILL
ncbi:MAG: nucleoside transporter C-terminal domain-containing protein [Bdellovibrionota bacterium]